MNKVHKYNLSVEWTGNKGKGTKTYSSYSRNHKIEAEGKEILSGSADPAFSGDSDRYNPEELLVASVSACHMLWYLHLCADAGVEVISYKDNAEGNMKTDAYGSGSFSEIILKPVIRVTAGSDIELAKKLHIQANKKCFIANSCNFPVRHRPVIEIAGSS